MFGVCLTCVLRVLEFSRIPDTILVRNIVVLYVPFAVFLSISTGVASVWSVYDMCGVRCCIFANPRDHCGAEYSWVICMFCDVSSLFFFFLVLLAFVASVSLAFDMRE